MSGRDATRILVRVTTQFEMATPRVAHLASVYDPLDGTVLDEALITLFRGPNSYTGEDVVEVSVHGGAVVPTLVLRALINAGARQALAGEFTRRAVVNGRLDLLQSEAGTELIDAQSRLARRAATGQRDGALTRRAIGLRDHVLEIEAIIEYDIAFPEEDEGSIGHTRLGQALGRTLHALDEL